MKKTLTVIRIVLGCSLATLSSSRNFVQAQRPNPQCYVSINKPQPGDRLTVRAEVTGTARRLQETYLWILAHPMGVALWWPQGSGPTPVMKDHWTTFVFIGSERDVGRDFEIAAILVDQDENSRLRQWVDDAERSGQYSGIRFPRVVAACSSATVRVRR
jgi:hypothetical protein